MWDLYGQPKAWGWEVVLELWEARSGAGILTLFHAQDISIKKRPSIQCSRPQRSCTESTYVASIHLARTFCAAACAVALEFTPVLAIKRF